MITLQIEQLTECALGLSPAERTQLAARLLESVDQDFELSDEWKTELATRIRKIESGRADNIPHEAARQAVRKGIEQAAKQKSA